MISPLDLARSDVLLIVPQCASVLSFVVLINQIYRSRLADTTNSVDAPQELDLDPLPSSKFRSHVAAFGGTRIFCFEVARLAGCLLLLGLSLFWRPYALANPDQEQDFSDALERQITLGPPGSLDKWSRPLNARWLWYGISATFLYASLLSILCVAIKPTRWFLQPSMHVTSILITSLFVFVVRDVYPLCTFTLEPVDLPSHAGVVQTSLLWSLIGILFFVGIGIPLLQPRRYIPVDPKHPSRQPSPEQTCSLLSLFVYSYLDPTLSEIKRLRKLSSESLPPLTDVDQAENLRARGFPHLDRFRPSADREQLEERHIFWGLMRTFRTEFIVMAFLHVIHAFAGYVTPIGLNRLLYYMETNGQDAFIRPWVWLAWMFAIPVADTLLFQRCIFISGKIRMQADSILCQLLFEHAFRIRPTAALVAQSELPSPRSQSAGGINQLGNPPTQQEAIDNNLIGKLNNLLSTDVANIIGGSDFLLLFFYFPVQLSLGIYFLYIVLGWSAFVGLAAMVILAPIPGFIAKKLQGVQRVRMRHSDQRVGRVAEVMGIIRNVKILNWEKVVKETIDSLRNSELNWVRRVRMLELINACINYLLPVLIMLVTYGTYTLVMKRELSASIVFSSMTVFDMLRTQLQMVSLTVTSAIRAKVSLDRLDDFLRDAELLVTFNHDGGTEPNTAPTTSGDIRMNQVHFTWSENASPGVFSLKVDEEILFQKHGLNLVVGPTGSGKTALLLALLGELHCVHTASNSCCILPRIKGVSYSPQASWILNGTIRDNIVLGTTFDEQRYKDVVHQCCLEADLESLDAGDQTQVGDRGYTLSGGQKARLSLARAIYRHSEIVILDDPLASLDTYTSKWIVEKCFLGNLVKDRTLILSTHNVALVSPLAASIISVELDGSVTSKVSSSEAPLRQPPTKLVQTIEISPSPKVDRPIGHAALFTREDVEGGYVGWHAFRIYLSSLSNHHPALFLLTFSIGLGLAEAMFGFLTWFLGFWASQYHGHGPPVPTAYYISVYGGLNIVNVLVYAMTSSLIIFGGLRASRVLHRLLIESVLGATLRWLDTTPVARIVSRCTQDIRTVDDGIPQGFASLAQLSISMFVKLGAVAIFTPLFLGPTAVMIILGVLLVQTYLSAQLLVKREMSNAKSTVLGRLATALDGIAVIRAYGTQEDFRQTVLIRINKSTRVSRLFFDLNRWMNVRIDGLSKMFTLVLGVYLVYFERQGAGNTGFVLNMAVGFSTIIVAWARSFNDFEVQANSLERIQSYLQIDQEQKDLHQDDPPQLWPQSGTLSVVGLSSWYSLDGPKVLDDVSFHVVSGERIGVIGKTGSGKTSLILSLLRGIPTEGIVSFDGIPINIVNLGTWRSKVSVIPQTPALMSGTLRQNLDPYSEYDDPSLNSALESAGFFAFKRTDDSRRFTLDTPISNGGTDISVGQRQMIALVRASLHRSKLLILDEATSAIDFETESLIQSSLRRSFREDVTVIIVAHRLRTVMDLDKIMVLDSGRLIEFDSPSKLLADGRSRLRSLVDQSTDRDILLRLAGTSGL